jgi:hypothetical protein
MSPPSDPAIEVKDLVRTYRSTTKLLAKKKETTAIDHISSRWRGARLSEIAGTLACER